MKLKIPLPPKFIDVVYEKIDSNIDLGELTNSQRNKIFTILIEFYICILCKESDYNDYANIYHKEFGRYRIKLNGKLYWYSFFLEMLESSYPAKLIDVNNKYSNVGKTFCKSYRINSTYLGFEDIEHMQEVEIDLDRINKNNKDEKYWVKKYPAHKKLIQSSFKTRVSLNELWIFMMKNQGMKLRLKLKNNRIINTYLTYSKILHNYINAVEINNKKLWFRVSNEGRMYSSITNLTHLASDYLTIEKRELFELDVANCQPLLLNLMVNHKQFKEDTEANLFYYKIGEELNENKETTKILMYRWIFFNLNPVKSGKVFNAFNQLYPGLIEQINQLKGEMNLACAMQSIESKIFINNIAIYMDDIITKHDAILCPAEQRELIKHKIKEEFMKLGLNAVIKNK